MKSQLLVWTLATALSSPLAVPTSVAARQNERQLQQENPIRLTTDLVSLNVMVTDRAGRAVLGLRGDDFKVYEDRVEQRISFFSSDETPVSWGLILDRSGSMMEMIADVYRAALHVVDEGTDRDETFVATFNNRVELACDFESDKHKMENSVLGLRAEGETALWDAVVYGLERMNKSKNRKKVLVVITDGDDNASKTRFRDLIERVEEADVLIYPVGMFESGLSWRPITRMATESSAQLELEKLAEASGGRAHFPSSVNECKQAMREIALEVSQQYSIGYYPDNTVRDGKWRRIQVKVEPGSAAHVARTRAGYYAPGPRS